MIYFKFRKIKLKQENYYLMFLKKHFLNLEKMKSIRKWQQNFDFYIFWKCEQMFSNAKKIRRLI